MKPPIIRKAGLFGENSPHWKGGKKEKICQVCGINFQIWKYEIKNRKYCSKNCLFKSKERNNKIAEATRKRMLGKKMSEETKRKMSIAKKKEWALGLRDWKHLWTPQANKKREEAIKKYLATLKRKEKNRKRKDERNDSLYQWWVYQVKKRDNWQCKINNQDCSGYTEVHHILSWKDFPELRYNINNGITLCQYHHPRKKDDEQRLIPFFQEMVRSKELI